jgi:hypothetical protein
MNKLIKIIAPALAASLALGAAVPASAATWEGRHEVGRYETSRHEIGRQIAQLDRQVDMARARHLISWRESASLGTKVDRLQKLYRVYARNGLSRAEVRVLDNRIDAVKRDLARQTNDRNRFAYNDRQEHRR